MTDAPILEVPICACTKPMSPIPGRPDAFFCTNCDVIQPQEAGEDARPRHKTVWDHKFHLAWERRKRNLYPDIPNP